MKEDHKPEWAEAMKSSPFLASHFTVRLRNQIIERASLRSSERLSTLSIVGFSLTLILIVFVAIPNFRTLIPVNYTASIPHATSDQSWNIRHSYFENGNNLFTIFPDPNFQAGNRNGYMIHFTAPFDQFQGKTLAIRAVHKETGIQTILQHPIQIIEPSSGYESLGRYTVFFALPLGGTWRHIVELDGIQYGEAVLAIKEPSWEVSPLFTSGVYQMRGIKLNVGFIDAGFIAGKGNKYMWHFWGSPENIEGDFTVLAVKEGSKQVIQVVNPVNISAQALNGADNALPSSMSLPEPGRWRLMPFMNGKLIASIIVEVRDE